ncbi:MAG: hypothetical protein HY819_13080 [Acidobacteria bacterium]|nr:hypothetical protein [Acidobacteriota bacterium]
MNEKLRKLLFREENKNDLDPQPQQSAESHLVIHKTSSAQRCEICHQSDLFNPQTGECSRCGVMPKTTVKESQQVTEQIAEQIIASNRIRLISFIAILALGSILYKFLVWGRLDQTAALFIGLPTILAILAAFIPKQKTFTGTILKGLTLSLLMAAIFSAAFLGEGVICIFMAAPLFYVVGIIIGVILDIINKNPEDLPPRNNKRPLSAIVFIPFLIMSLEGLTENLSFSRNEIVSVEKVVLANSQMVEKTLANFPQFTTELPFYLTLQFPRPEVAYGNGLKLGDTRTILFAGGEGLPGTLVLRVVSSESNRVVFQAISDKSEINKWLSWQESIVEWQEIDPNHTKVRWTIKYKRNLDPSWYFAPWQRYAVGLSAEYLIDNLATPKEK